MKTNHVLLIADDEPEISEQLVELMTPLGCSIVAAKDGKEALHMALTTANLATILSDINMPVLSGIEVLKKIRERGVEVPVIFLTGYGDKDRAVEALRFGAMDFLEKPYDPDHLKNVVEKSLEIGARIQTIDEEIDLLSKKYSILSEDLAQFKAIQKAVLLMKVKNSFYFKRKP